MGVYLYGSATPAGRRGLGGWLRSLIGGKSGLIALRGKLVRSIGTACQSDWVFAKCLRVFESKDEVAVRLYPASEYLELKIEGGKIHASARTSTIGPGYHAALVELLEQAGRACGLEWDWSEDESGYGVDRDFGKLQSFMVEQLRLIAEALCAVDQGMENPNIVVNWNVDFPVPAVRPYFVTPMGHRSVEWAKRVYAGNMADVEDSYSWWARDRGPREWAKLAAVVLWPAFPWRLPANDYERLQLEVAREACRRAGPEQLQLVGIGPDEVRELEELAAGRTIQSRPEGYGLRRKPVSWPYGAWTVVFPGDAVRDGKNLSVPGLSVYVGIQAVGAKPKVIETCRKLILDILASHELAEVIDISSEHILRLAGKKARDDGALQIYGFALTGTPDGMRAELATVVIDYPSKAEESRAMEIFQSLHRPPMTNKRHTHK